MKKSAPKKKDGPSAAIKHIQAEIGKGPHKEIAKKYALARKHYKTLDRKDRADVFPAMKKIKEQHDISLIHETHEKIKEALDYFRESGKLDEGSGLESYNDAQEAYQSLPEERKLETYGLMSGTYHGLLIAMLEQRMTMVQKELTKKKEDREKAVGIYAEIMGIYDKLPEEAKEAVYPQVKGVYSMIIQERKG
jgi:hypothetical protein